MDNPYNKLISKEKVEAILNSYGPIGDNNTKMVVNNLENYQKAFIHESYYMAVQNLLKGQDEFKVYINYIPDESSERLEFLGDHILKAVMGRYLYERFDNEREGFLTRLKIRMEKTSMLHKLAEKMGFREYILLSTQVEKSGILGMWRGRNVLRNCENAFEAFIGSIMVDNGEAGYRYAERFVRKIIENEIDFSEMIACNDNYKDSLQRYFQSKKWKTPEYDGIEEDGPVYRRIFTRGLWIDETKLTEFNDKIQDKIKQLTEQVLEEYKTKKMEIYNDIFEKRVSGKYLLGIGYGKKVVDAEQDCSKHCLQNISISLNY